MKRIRIFAGIVVLFAASAWPQQPPGGSAMSLQLSSTAFPPGGDIPSKYTCSGADVSPALSWNDPPTGTQSFALIADDPDAPAGTWVHWVAYDLPASARQLPEGVPKTDTIPGGGVQGQNDFRKTGYGGPCPPPGKPHRYYFKLYALDRKLDLKPGEAKKAVEQAIQGHILAQAELMGRFQR
jgi:Raf kinase inhibitor-like YbhB/YbcL family protein